MAPPASLPRWIPRRAPAEPKTRRARAASALTLAADIVGPSPRSDRSIASLGSYRSLLSAWSAWSAGSVGSFVSAASAGSALSIASVGSIMSIGSTGSILSIGAAGGFLSVGGRRRDGDVTGDEARPPHLAVVDQGATVLGALALAAALRPGRR